MLRSGAMSYEHDRPVDPARTVAQTGVPLLGDSAVMIECIACGEWAIIHSNGVHRSTAGDCAVHHPQLLLKNSTGWTSYLAKWDGGFWDLSPASTAPTTTTARGRSRRRKAVGTTPMLGQLDIMGGEYAGEGE